MKDKVLKNRYHLLKTLSKSNFSQTFLARDTAITSKPRLCVIKKLIVIDKHNTRLLEKIKLLFEQEAEILRILSQKNRQIPQFYDYFVEVGNYYLVQEWIQGITLQQKLQQQETIPPEEVKRILVHFLPVLDYIHKHGIIHRDLKPSNIILRSGDRLPILIDFGVAHKVTPQVENNKQLYFSTVGTPGYMSLEQAMGQADFSSDLYSLGLTAIHLLTGKEPLDLRFDLNSEEIFWHQEASNFDQDLVKVINRAISSNPRQRFSSAKQMLAALQSSSFKLNLTSSINTVDTYSQPQTIQKSSLKKPRKLLSLISMIGLKVAIVILGLNNFLPKLIKQPTELSVSLLSSPIELPPVVSSAVTEAKITKQPNILSNLPLFRPGTSEEQVLQTLGEPIWRKQGYWHNSIAWSYQDVMSDGVDLGYLFDTQTKKLRQTEIAFPASTDLESLQQVLSGFLGGNTPDQINQGLKQVYFRKMDQHLFTVGNLKGIIQRNQQKRIYIGVWEADFH
ncbi:serine/threonine protein kinase [Stanieria cyanosphaera PCC 7437]|uniref:non-specific serine/threonine protein kinase n=1 Tax=Stanieria cyanosphaera (strain ATCC 29371 / PCC 7437) TaxID=111780 RepID=K9XSM2_STAC7|nr:protein kinase [Stanieria cyanosphaera]AFZ35600.1 serine/threonine protein kinase [Stanieria cyanosphaera PCC 7437]